MVHTSIVTRLTVTNQSIPRTGGGESAHQIPAYLDPYLILISRRYSAADTPQIYTYVYEDTFRLESHLTRWSYDWRPLSDLSSSSVQTLKYHHISPPWIVNSAVPFQKERTFIDTSLSHTTKN